MERGQEWSYCYRTALGCLWATVLVCLPRSSNGSGCWPFKPVIRVRFPYGVLNQSYRDVGQRQPACFGNTRSSVRFRPSRLRHCRNVPSATRQEKCSYFFAAAGTNRRSRPGVVTEACRSDKAAAVVRLHLGLLKGSRVQS